jgi:hypothetical protein
MYFSGQHGSLAIATNGDSKFFPVGRLKNWSYTTQQQTLDTTCLADVDKTIINGVRSTTGQASLLYYEESALNSSNVHLMGHDLIKTGQPNNPDTPTFGASANQPDLVLIKLALPGGNGPASRTTQMYAYITSFSMSCSVGEVVQAEISWEAHGAPFEWQY